MKPISAVKIINLPWRKDRRGTLFTNLRRTGVFSNIRQEIVTPLTSPPPNGWSHSAALWSCLATHLDIIGDINPAAGPVVILEDDAFFVDGSAAAIEQLLAAVPDDWGQIYLGGRHTDLRERVNDHIFRGARIVACHAYLVNPSVAVTIADFIRETIDIKGGVPIDEAFAAGHSSGAWRAYCPDRWIAGQRSGFSDLAGKHRPARI